MQIILPTVLRTRTIALRLIITITMAVNSSANVIRKMNDYWQNKGRKNKSNWSWKELF